MVFNPDVTRQFKKTDRALSLFSRYYI